MEEKDIEAICKCMARVTAWGSEGSVSSILDRLEKEFPQKTGWRKTFNRVYEDTVREQVGVVTSASEAISLLEKGYWLANEDAIFNPPPRNGLYKYIDFELYKLLGGRALRVDGTYKDGTKHDPLVRIKRFQELMRFDAKTDVNPAP